MDYEEEEDKLKIEERIRQNSYFHKMFISMTPKERHIYYHGFYEGEIEGRKSSFTSIILIVGMLFFIWIMNIMIGAGMLK